MRSSIVIGLFALACIPGVTFARSQGIKFLRAPQVVEPKNSQTMALLEGGSARVSTSTPRLAIVDDTALGAAAESTEYFDTGKSGGQISVYVVRNGDTLPVIAKMYGVSVNTIRWANDIKGSTVKEGQELVILPISGVRHTVKAGDTIKSITAKYKADLDEVLAYNDLSADSALSKGQEIIVPDGEVAAAKASVAKSSVKPVSGTSSYSGYYMKPINGARRTQGLHGHNGIDFGAPTGTAIMASASGKVIIAKSSGYNGGYGSYVVISHGNGTQTLYAHLSSVGVSVGQTVSQGQVIGGLGNTGKSTGPHLHFEIRGATNPF